MFLEINSKDLNRRTRNFKLDVFSGVNARNALLDKYFNFILNTPEKELTRKEKDFKKQLANIDTGSRVTESLGIKDIKTFDINLLLQVYKDRSYTTIEPNISLRTKPSTHLLNQILNLSKGNTNRTINYARGESGEDFISKTTVITEHDYSLVRFNQGGFRLLLQFFNDILELQDFRSNSNKDGDISRGALAELTNNKAPLKIFAMNLALDCYNVYHNRGNNINLDLISSLELLKIYTKELTGDVHQYNSIHKSVLKNSDQSKPFIFKDNDNSFVYNLTHSDHKLYERLSENNRQYNSIMQGSVFKHLNEDYISAYAKEPNLLFREALYVFEELYHFLPVDDNGERIPIKNLTTFYQVFIGKGNSTTYEINGKEFKSLSYYLSNNHFRKDFWDSCRTITKFKEKIETGIQVAKIDWFSGYNSKTYNYYNFDKVDEDISLKDKIEILSEELFKNVSLKFTLSSTPNTLYNNPSSEENVLNLLLKIISECFTERYFPIRITWSSSFPKNIDYTDFDFDIMEDGNTSGARIHDRNLSLVLDIYRRLYINGFYWCNFNPMELDNYWCFEYARPITTPYELHKIAGMLQDDMLLIKKLLRARIRKDFNIKANVADEDNKDNIIRDSDFVNYIKDSAIIREHIEGLIHQRCYLLDKAGYKNNILSRLKKSSNKVNLYYNIPIYFCLGEVVNLAKVTYIFIDNTKAPCLYSIPIGQYLLVAYYKGHEKTGDDTKFVKLISLDECDITFENLGDTNFRVISAIEINMLKE